MKKFALISLLFVGIFNGFSQTPVTLTFQAKDSLTQNPLALDSVHVTNLAVSCDTALYDAVSVLNLLALWPVGLEESGPGSETALRIMPNPFEGKTQVRIWLNEQGPLNLVLCDRLGKTLAQYQGWHGKGWHLFAVSSGNPGMLFLLASGSRGTRTVKLINTGASQETGRITCYGPAGMMPDLKSSQAGPGFIYYLGDQLRYTAYAGGYHASVLYDSPLSNQTYTFAMVAQTVVTLPLVSTTPATAITQTAAVSGGNVLSDGGATVTARGVCYSTTPNPTMASNITSDGSGTGPFVSVLTGLTPATPYYVRAYAINSAGTAYGNEETFSTMPVSAPTVNTTPAYAIAQTTATSGGNVTSDGGAAVTARGVCWSTTPAPTTAGNHTSDGTGPGMFNSNLSGLAPNTLYYLRAYATNSIGTSYGAEHPFTTLSLVMPSVTTTAASNITQTTATSGGNVTGDGGASVTARGVCWSTSTGPTTAGSHTTDGGGTGVFVSSLTGLTASTVYYIRAYAVNTIGTSYGNELTFTTSDLLPGTPCPGIPTVTDVRDGQIYPTVQIGSQCWLQKNMNFSTGTSWCYENSSSNCDTYGRLYDWSTALTACPSGWHLPGNAEYTALTDFLGGGLVAGGHMKSTSGWYNNGNGTNSSGFTALPGGRRNAVGNFDFLTQYAHFWSSTEFDATMAWGRSIYYLQVSIETVEFGKVMGLSVRCIKD